MKICFTCEREFAPSSNHKNCPSCRKEAAKTPCVDCGVLCGRTYERCTKCSSQGEYNPNWKGGRTRHKAGYVMVRVPHHPRSAANNGYVFEHIFVMEEALGRYLLQGENVHHINGVKDDNRLDNLELWCKPQPSGIRAKEAYEHALAIIELYGEDYEKGIL